MKTMKDNKTPGNYRALTRIVDTLFTLTLAGSFVLGIVMVIAQVIATILGATDLIVAASTYLGPPTYAMAATAGVLSLPALYLHGWSIAE
jgi:hypothetical protein